MNEILSIGTPRKKIRPVFDTAKVSKTVDYLDKLVGAEGSRFTLDNGTISLPATKEVSRILGLPLVHNATYRATELPCGVFFRGINYFTGVARLNNSQRSGRPSSYELDLIGNGGEFWRLVGALTMHELDLGTIRVSRGTIQNSWGESYATGFDYIFPPVLYGKPSGRTTAGGTEPAFSDLDFRPAVYYPAIIRAVEQATGYTINSNFFELPIFQDSVYLCTRAASQIKQVLDDFCQANFLRIKNKTYLNGELLDWPTKSGCPYLSLSPDGSTVIALADMRLRLTLNAEGTDLDEILITINGSSNQAFQAADPAFINQVVEIDVQSGDAITLVVNNPTAGGSTILFANYLIDRVYNPDVIADTDIYLATAMHPHSVRDFLNAISHQFGLLWSINSATKTITVEPRFNYLFEGTRYQGYYNEVATPIKPVRNTEPAAHTYPDFFGKALQLGYEQSGNYLFELLQGVNPDETIPVHGVRFDTGSSSARGTSIMNPLFSVLPTLQYASFSELPAILGTDYDAESEDLLDEWTSEGIITCGLVYRGNATIQYDENTANAAVYNNAPFVCQWLPNTTLNGQPLDKNYQVAYADGNVVGLVSTFYRQYLALVQAPEILTTPVRLSAQGFSLEDFRNLRTVTTTPQRTTWIAISINDFRPASGLGSYQFIKFTPITGAVVDAIQHYTL